MPDVMLVQLPAELWQVLVFWATRQAKRFGHAVDWESSRQEIVRFALFWRLCVFSNNEKAASWSFWQLQNLKPEPASFPGAELYRCLVGTPDDSCAHALISPDDFESLLCKECSPAWRSDTERFVNDKNERNHIGAAWWVSSHRTLPWLQRDYIRTAFPGYVPLTDHEDDLPYDIDHVIPKADWNDWVSIKRRVQDVGPATLQRMQWWRAGIGESIGNKRLVDSPTNARDQDNDISKKMIFLLENGRLTSEAEMSLVKMAFSPEHRAAWAKVSREGPTTCRKWDNSRLAAFQSAVEQRAAWLYRQFHDDLGFNTWVSAQLQQHTSEEVEKPG